jgi:hypothetical protein
VIARTFKSLRYLMNLSPSHTLANALRSTLWLAAHYSNMNENGPALHELKIAIGRAIVELEAYATTEYKAAYRPEAETREAIPSKQRSWTGLRIDAATPSVTNAS